MFREFVTELLATQGVTLPDRSVPAGVAGVAAAASRADLAAAASAPARRRSPASRSGSPRRSARSTSRGPSASSATGRSCRARQGLAELQASATVAPTRLTKKRLKRPIEISSPSSSSRQLDAIAVAEDAVQAAVVEDACPARRRGRASAWRRETVGSSKRTCADRLRPIRVQPSWSGNTRTRSSSSKAR